MSRGPNPGLYEARALAALRAEPALPAASGVQRGRCGHGRWPAGHGAAEPDRGGHRSDPALRGQLFAGAVRFTVG